MSESLLDLVRELNALNDDNLAERVIKDSDVQWCLSELQDILEAETSTLTPPNEPLTLEQLREMDGQPVWVKVIGKTGIRCDGWCEVEIREKDPFAYVWWPGSEVEDIAKIEDYGKTWACYAYPSAHIDREGWEKPCSMCGGKTTLYADCCMKGISANSAFKIKFCPECGRPLTEEAWAELEKRMGVRA